MIKILLGNVDCCTVQVPVYLADAEAVPELKDLYGCYIAARNEIAIAHDNAPATLRFYVRHEVMHAVYDHGGLADFIAGTTEDGAEEVFVRAFCPALSRAWDA